MRDADGWPETRERLRQVVMRRGVSEVASMIPVSRQQLHRLLSGETSTPSLPTLECVERMIDDESDLQSRCP